MFKPAITIFAILFTASVFAGGVGLGGIGASPQVGAQQNRVVVSKISGCKWPDITDEQYRGNIEPISCPGNTDAAWKAEHNRFKAAAWQCESLPCLLSAIGY